MLFLRKISILAICTLIATIPATSFADEKIKVPEVGTIDMPSKATSNAGSPTTVLSRHYIDRLHVNGAQISNEDSNVANNLRFYGESSTEAATAQKEVSIPSITKLEAGQIIAVKPTITSTQRNSTIKLNDFAAYPMRYNGSPITTSTDSIVWNQNYVSFFVFDGTYWQFAGGGIDTIYYGMTQEEITATTPGTTNRLVSPQLLRQNLARRPQNAAVGSATKPVYVASDGMVTEVTHELNADVPATAVFTDTVTTVKNSDGTDGASTAADGSVQVTKDGTTTYPVVRGWSTKENTSNKLAQGSATTSVIADNATNDTKFPTVKAVADYVTGQGYITSAALPTVNDATLTIQKNGTTIDTFTANSATNKTINIQADKNVIETVKANGTALTVTDKAVDIPTMGAASSGAAGTVGLVPASSAGDQNKVLSAAGTWVAQPTVNNATLTVQLNGTSKGTFTANASSNKTINIDGVQTTANLSSSITTDTGSTTKYPSVKAVEDYVTGQGYITNAAIPTALSAFTDDIDAANTINTVKANGTALTVTDKAVNIPNMTGATASAAGKDGLVPAPSAGAQTKYLRGDGTWAGEFTGATSSAAGTAGLVKKPAAGDQAKYLRGDGTWAGEFTGATSSAAGTAGLVKKPAAGDQAKYLRGDGTWGTPTDTNTTYTASDGVTLTGTNFTNSGVRSVATGTGNDGTISVNTNGTAADVAVKGWANKQNKNTVDHYSVNKNGTWLDASDAITADETYLTETANATDGSTQIGIKTANLASAVGNITSLTSSSTAADKGKLTTAWAVNQAIYYDTNHFAKSHFVNAAPLSNENSVYWGLSDTSESTGAKTVTIDSLESTAINTGVFVIITPKATTNVPISTLNVNNTGAFPISYNGSTTISAADSSKIWKEGVPSMFVFDVNSEWAYVGSDTDTTYTASNGVTLTGTNFTNSGVRAVSASDSNAANGTIKVNTNGTNAHVAVKGWSTKQDTLIAGTNITIGADGKTISATDTTYNEFTGATSSADGAAGLVKKPLIANRAQFLRGDGTWATPTNTTYSVFTGATASANGTSGLVKAPSAGDQGKFLRGDGTWAVDNNTTYSVFTGANGTTAGTSGLVKAPAATDNTKFLKGDGTWGTPTDTNTTYTASNGVTLTGTNFTNSGVRSVATGTGNDGTISVNTNGTAADVAVKGWANKQNKPATAEVAAGKVLTYNGTGDANGTNNYSAKYIQVPVANNAPNGSNVTVSTLADIWVE